MAAKSPDLLSDNEVRPDVGAAVVVLTNEDAGDTASTIGRLALDVILGAAAATPEVRQALAIHRDLQHGTSTTACCRPI